VVASGRLKGGIRAMSKKDEHLAKLKRQILEDRQRLFDSVPEDKRLELERQAEIDIPQFMTRRKSSFDWLNQQRGADIKRHPEGTRL